MSRPKQRKGGRVTPRKTASRRGPYGGAEPFAPGLLGASPNEPLVGPLSGSWAEERDDPSGGDPEILALAGDAIVSGHPAELLALASTLVEDLADTDRSEPPDTDQRESPGIEPPDIEPPDIEPPDIEPPDIEPPDIEPDDDESDDAELTWSDVVGELFDAVRPETTAVLYALRPFAPDEWARKIAVALARRPTPSLPAWISSIGEAEVTGVWTRSHEPGAHAGSDSETDSDSDTSSDSDTGSGSDTDTDTDDVFVGVRWPTGQKLTLIVHVARHPVAAVHDVLLAPAGVEAVKKVVVADDERTTFVQVDPSEARGRLIEAVHRWETTEPRPLSDDWPSMRPLLLWLLSTLPDGGSDHESGSGSESDSEPVPVPDHEPQTEPEPVRVPPTVGHAESQSAVAARSDRLPIGDEPIEVSVRWARTDAELRGVTLGEALDDRIAAHAELAAHLDTWDATITEIDDGDGFRDAVAVAAGADVTFALLTACNPMTVELSDDENDRRNRMLLEQVDPPLRSVGRSVDGSWSEVGFAMPMGPAAVEAAQRFSQAAIFVVSPVGREVLVLVGASPSALAEAAG